jgi:hypothetical protein
MKNFIKENWFKLSLLVIFLIFVLVYGIFQTKEAKTIKQLNTEKIQSPSVNNSSSLLSKQIECQKFKTDTEKQFPGASVSIYYSPNKDTCVFEMIAVKDGVLKSKMIGEVFGNHGYVIEQDGEVIYEKDEFGYNKSYSDIKKIILGN